VEGESAKKRKREKAKRGHARRLLAGSATARLKLRKGQRGRKKE